MAACADAPRVWLAIIVGFSFIIFVRLFGMLGTIPIASLKDLLPFIWVGVVVQALSGTLLWLTKPARYLEAGIFELKLALVVTGIVVTLYLHRMLSETGLTAAMVSARGIRFVVAAALVWSAVLIAGRLTAYFGIYATAIAR